VGKGRRHGVGPNWVKIPRKRKKKGKNGCFSPQQAERRKRPGKFHLSIRSWEIAVPMFFPKLKRLFQTEEREWGVFVSTGNKRSGLLFFGILREGREFGEGSINLLVDWAKGHGSLT